jgi:dethiobiotin synthetase
MSATFITATGTDAGKTFVAAGLIRHWRAAGREVEALKPVVTGFNPDMAASSDPGVLLAALGRPVTLPEIERIAPWRFSEPLSPDMAARRENRVLDFDRLVAFSRDAIASAKGRLLIEGIGGVMVPLDDSHTVLDWVTALNIPVVLVTGSYLGSLSHTLTSIDCLLRRQIAIKAVVVNETVGSTVTVADTIATLKRFATSIPMVSVPRLSAANAGHPAFGEIAGLL